MENTKATRLTFFQIFENLMYISDLIKIQQKIFCFSDNRICITNGRLSVLCQKILLVPNQLVKRLS